jgi:hypothetical protein
MGGRIAVSARNMKTPSNPASGGLVAYVKVNYRKVVSAEFNRYLHKGKNNEGQMVMVDES